ncbi:hypothetical protein B0J17DRAFT_417779 [Rhizoctonia solani]|nr:hypothetical protein B0J17DRAFT_417779 [Rhizoctonia solani]
MERDIFQRYIELTSDLKRTNTYLGCIAVQATLNLTFSVLPAYLIGRLAYYRGPFYLAIDISSIIVGICSLCLLTIALWPIAMLRASVPVTQLLTANPKDVFRGTISPERTRLRDLSILGQRRETTIPSHSPKPFPFIARSIKRGLAVLLFRRVRNVVTRASAFARNSFAVVAVGVLIFRTVTALQQAQNEIGTRAISKTCDEAASQHPISILSDRLIYDHRWNTTLPEEVTVEISAIWSDPRNGYEHYSTYQGSDSVDC